MHIVSRKKELAEGCDRRRTVCMQSFTPWLRPTLIGPLATLWTLITALHLLIGVDALSDGRIDSWAIAMLFATAYGCTLIVALIVSDLVLLKAKLRALPTGGRAWLSSILSPFAVSMVASLPLWPEPRSWLGVAVLIAAPIALGAPLVRLVFGRRP